MSWILDALMQRWQVADYYQALGNDYPLTLIAHPARTNLALARCYAELLDEGHQLSPVQAAQTLLVTLFRPPAQGDGEASDITAMAMASRLFHCPAPYGITARIWWQVIAEIAEQRYLSTDITPASSNQPQLILLCGISGSGKSTLIADRYAKATVISLDDIREQRFGERLSQTNNDKVVATAHRRLNTLLRPGHTVIWDATNYRQSYRQPLIDIGRRHHACIEIVLLQVSKATALSRNAEREHAIPAEAIERQIQRFELPAEDEADAVRIVFND